MFFFNSLIDNIWHLPLFILMTIQVSSLTIMIGYGSGRPGFILDRNSVFSLVITSKPTLGPGQPPTGLQ
jgi:hypothetical protein